LIVGVEIFAGAGGAARDLARLAWLGRSEERNAGRKAMQKVLAANGANLTLRKESGRRNIARRVGERPGVVMGLVEQPCAAAIATNDLRAQGW
jgi:hypothetical protein